MSKGNKHIKSDMIHERVGTPSKGRPGKYKGSKFVKKAGMYLEYENYNEANKTDKQNWS